MTRRALTLLAICLPAAVVLHTLRRPLPAPAAWSLPALHAWAGQHDSLVAGAATVRVIALAACVYCGVASAVVLLAGITRLRPLGLVVRVVTPRTLRPLLGVALLPALAPPSAFAATDTAPVMVQIQGPDASTAPIMRWAGARTATTTATPPAQIVAPQPSAAPSRDPAPAPAPAAEPDVWVIRRGDHLWAVAADTLEDRIGRAPTTREVGRYWRTLLAANHDRLVDPDNPDLVFAGQEIVLPPSL